MTTVRTQNVAIYVERSSQQWIVRDRDGNFWVVPPRDDAWDSREPFYPNEHSDLQPVPGHYKYVLGVPS
jgi:hypothetical protein